MDNSMQPTSDITTLIEKTERRFLGHPFFGRLLIAVLLAASYAIVYGTGGTQFAYVHVIYIPIIFASFSFPPLEVAVWSVLAGVCMGPLMPLNTDLQLTQTPYSWVLRSGFLILVGQILSYYILKRNALRNALIESYRQVAEVNELLEEKVQNRTAELEDKNLVLQQTVSQLEKTTRNRQELLHILCHDLKNPLGAILSSSQIFRTLSDLSSKEADACKDLISLSAQNALEVIKLIRDYEALELNKKVLELTSVNLRDCVNESLLIVASAIKKKDLTIDADIPDDLQVKVEQTSFIYSVLNNLLTNAIKFSHPGSTIRLSTVSAADTVALSIRDSGVGIPKELLDRLFDIHQKTTRHGTNGEEGTGFGMPLVKKFIEAYGGSMEIQSTTMEEDKTGHGTDVRLNLKSAEKQGNG